MWPHSKPTGFSTCSISVYLCTSAQKKDKRWVVVPGGCDSYPLNVMRALSFSESRIGPDILYCKKRNKKKASNTNLPEKWSKECLLQCGDKRISCHSAKQQCVLNVESERLWNFVGADFYLSLCSSSLLSFHFACLSNLLWKPLLYTKTESAVKRADTQKRC